MKNDLFILYYLANDPNGGSFDFLAKPKQEKEGIPIGQLFFWIKGAWEFCDGDLSVELQSLYLELMGVDPINWEDNSVIGPFQNIEELRRFSYLFCQKLNYKRVFLFSVDNLNEALKYSGKQEDVVRALKKSSDRLDNLDVKKSMNFFDRILDRKS